MIVLGPSRVVIRSSRPVVAVCTIGHPQQPHRPKPSLASFILSSRPFLPRLGDRSLSTRFLPRIVQPSFWKSLFPKFSKLKTDSSVEERNPKKKEWNPATFFIAMVMLIGSQAIQMISLRQDFVRFSNQTEARLAKLREVLRRIQNGEDVDVAAALGTGDNRAEREWEQVIRELEKEDELYRRKRRKAKPASPNIPEFGSNDSPRNS